MWVEKTVIPDWNNPIVLTRKDASKTLVNTFIGKRFDWWSPFALLMLVVLAGLFLAGAVLLATEFWYVGVILLASAIGMFLFLPMSRRKNPNKHA